MMHSEIGSVSPSGLREVAEAVVRGLTTPADIVSPSGLTSWNGPQDTPPNQAGGRHMIFRWREPLDPECSTNPGRRPTHDLPVA